MPPVEPSSHMTTCIQVRAVESIRRQVQQFNYFQEEPAPRCPVLAVVSVIGDRFARYLPPNFCVQMHAPVNHDELRLFLAPAMRNSLTMCHVFKMQLLLTAEHDQPMDSEKKLALLLTEMRSRLTYITALRVSMHRRYTEAFFRCKRLRNDLVATFAGLSLQCVSLEYTSIAMDIRLDTIRVFASMPHLHELRLFGTAMVMEEEAVSELFRDERPSDGTFFPRLRILQATAMCRNINRGCSNYVQMLTVASGSCILPQLWELAVQTELDDEVGETETDVDVATLHGLLSNLQHMRALGNNVLASRFNFCGGPLDLSPLQGCRRVGKSFLRDAKFNNHTLDLSVLTDLEEIGTMFLHRSSNITALVFPPRVKRIAAQFCHLARGFAALDFTPVAQSLQSIDVSALASRSDIVKFDSRPLAGKIVGPVDQFLDGCGRLVEVDLGGMANITAIAGRFLAECEALKRVLGMEGLRDVTVCGDKFFWLTKSLVVCDFQQMVSLKTMENDWMLFDGCRMKQKAIKILGEIMKANKKQ